MYNTNDTELIEMITDSREYEKGYRLLIGQYKERLYWHIRRIVKNHDDADDILQNTFIKVIKNIEKFKQESSLQTWLYRIATNESISFINNKKHVSADLLDNNVLTVVSDDEVDYENVKLKLSKAIDLLPHKQKIVFNLRYYDEMSYQEIANITHTSVGALKSSFHLAVKKIEDFLKKEI